MDRSRHGSNVAQMALSDARIRGSKIRAHSDIYVFDQWVLGIAERGLIEATHLKHKSVGN